MFLRFDVRQQMSDRSLTNDRRLYDGGSGGTAEAFAVLASSTFSSLRLGYENQFSATVIGEVEARGQIQMIRFKVNGKEKTFDGDVDMPLLWYLRDVAELTGTKFGCGMALCGACTVHQNGGAIRSCTTAMS